MIVPYPKHRHVDAILALQGDDTWRPEGERAYVDDEADTSAFGSDDEIEAEAEDRDDEGEAEADSHPVEGESEAECPPDEQGDARSSGPIGETPAVAGQVAVSAAAADKHRALRSPHLDIRDRHLVSPEQHPQGAAANPLLGQKGR